MKFKKFPNSAALLNEDAKTLAETCAKYVWLPNLGVIERLGAVAYFPTARGNKKGERNTRFEHPTSGPIILDYNGTPAWSLLWPHGYNNRPIGWRLAHIWEGRAQDPEAFTNPANLCLISGSLMSLTDIGKGYTPPLMSHLKYHSYSKYGWCPSGISEVSKPDNYDLVSRGWNYLQMNGDPYELLKFRFNSRKNVKAKEIKKLGVNIPWRKT